MSNVCIMCGSSENLNTSMNINIDGKKTNVYVCDEHADDTTPGMAKAKYKDLLDSIDALSEQAEILGYKLVPIDQEVCCDAQQPAQESKTSQKVPQGMRVQKRKKNTGDGEEYVDAARANTIISGASPTVSSEGVPMTNAGTYNVEKAQNDAGVSKKRVRVDVAQGPGGVPIPIPGHTIDETGETTIEISQNFTDKDLQNRFKQSSADR